jgi:hypothetical protein
MYEVDDKLKQEPFWGVVKRRRYMNMRQPNVYQEQFMERAEVIANPTSHHPAAILGSNLTHEEATAIAKMFNSGELHGTN